MGIYSTVVSSALGLIIILNEILRTKKTKPVDILTGVNVLFFLSFVIPPFSYYFWDIETTKWAHIVNLNNGSSLIATFYSLIGYLMLIAGYHFWGKLNLSKKTPSNFELNESKIEKFAHFLGIIGIVFLVIFIYFIGGISNFFSTNTLYRSGSIDVSPFAFIRNLALFIPLSCQIFYCLYKFYDKRLLNKYHILFIFYFILSLSLYFNRATRMGLLVFLISFFVINAIYYRKSIVKYIPIIIILFLTFLFYGKRFYNFFVLDEFTISDVDVNIDIFINQFSFPFFTLTNAIDNSFFNNTPRLFMDFIYGILNLFPTIILPFDVPKNITQLNSDFFSMGIPIDLISLGYYSFGISGIIIITFLFGMFIKVIENILMDKKNILTLVFYTQFIFFISLRIPYAGPTNVLKSNICLLISFIIYIFVFEKKSVKKF